MRRMFCSVARCPKDFIVVERLDDGGVMVKDWGGNETLV